MRPNAFAANHLTDALVQVKVLLEDDPFLGCFIKEMIVYSDAKNQRASRDVAML